MRFLILFSFLLLGLAPSFGQLEVKSFKKVIPVKKLTKVSSINSSEDIFYFESKFDSGIWNNSMNKIIMNHVLSFEPIKTNTDFFLVTTQDKKYLLNTKTGSEVIEGNLNLWIRDIPDTNVLIFGTDELVGYLDWRTLNIEADLFKKLSNNLENGMKYFRSDTVWTDMSQYQDWELLEYSIEPYSLSEVTYRFFKRGNFLIQECIESDSVLVLNPSNGSTVKTFVGEHLWTDRLFVRVGDGKYNYYASNPRSYYNSKFEVVVDSMLMYKFNKEQFSIILGKDVTRMEQQSTRVYTEDQGIYTYQADGMYGIYSVYSEKDLIEPQEFIFEMGEDIHRSRMFQFYTVTGNDFGFYSTKYGWEVEPNKKSIKLLALGDGSYGYLADGILYKKPMKSYDLRDSIGVKATDEMLKNSIVVHYIEEKNNKLLLGGRFWHRDDHDDAYYSNTNYDTNYGIIGYGEDTTYLTGRIHHVEYFDEHYIVQDVANTYGYPDVLTILNKNLDTITLPHTLRFSWLWNGMFLTNTNGKLVEYDLKNKKIKRTLGPAFETRDFHVMDNYLLLGHNEYSRYERRSGDYKFDIASIIRPSGEMVEMRDMIALKMLGEDIALVGQVPRGHKPKGSYTDFPIGRHFKPNKKALYDLKTGKLLTEWQSTMYVLYNTLYIVDYGPGEDDYKETQIEQGKIREWLKNR